MLAASTAFRILGLLTGSPLPHISPLILVGLSAPVLIGLFQIQPLPDGVVRRFASDAGLRTRHDLFPDNPETLDGKVVTESVAASTLRVCSRSTNRRDPLARKGLHPSLLNE